MRQAHLARRSMMGNGGADWGSAPTMNDQPNLPVM